MPDQHLLTALRLLLTPAIKFALRHSFQLQDIYELAKLEFLRLARSTLHREGIPDTLSKLSVMTGIPRKFIATLSNKKDSEVSSKNLTKNILDLWQTDSRFGYGHRKQARSLTCEGNESEFAQLVRAVNVDLNPYTILNEFERIKLISRRAGKVSLCSRLYIEKDFIEALTHASLDSDCLFKVVDHNVNSTEQEHLHLSTSYDNIPDEHLDEIRKWFLEQGSQFQLKAREYLSRFDRDSGRKKLSPDGRNTVRVVLYEFSEASED